MIILHGFEKYIVSWVELREVEVFATSLQAAIRSAKISNGKCIDRYDYDIIKGDN